MFDNSQSKTIDLFLENPEEKTIVIKEDHILEELKQEDELNTFQDFEFINLVRSALVDTTESAGGDNAEIALQLPYPTTKQMVWSRFMRLLGWRYFHRVDDLDLLQDVESLHSGVKYTEAEEVDDENLLPQEEQDEDENIADLLTMEEEETGEIHRVAKRFFITDIVNKIQKLFFRSDSVIGFDIGTDYVKFVQLRRKKSSYILDRYRIGDIGRKKDDTLEIFRSKTIIALQRILPHDLLSISDVFVSISNIPVVIAIDTMPAMNPKELHQAVMFRAQKLVPQTMKNPHIEYEIIEKNDSTESSQLHLRFYIVDEDELQAWLQALRDSGIEPQKITLPHVAVHHNLAKFYPQEMAEGVAIFDIGGEKSQLIFAENGNIKLIRTLESGAGDFIKSLTGTLNIDGQEIDVNRKRAENLLREHGVSTKNSTKETEYGLPISRVGIMLYNSIEKLVNEIQRSVDYFRSTFPDSPIKSILVTGGGGNILNLHTVLEEKLTIPVNHFSYLQKMTIGRDITDVDQLLIDGNTISGSVGLALDSTNKLNLLPQQYQGKKQANLILTGFCVITMAILSILINETLDVNSIFNSYRTQLVTVNAELTSRMPRRNEYFALQDQLNSAANFQNLIAEQLNILVRDVSIENILIALSNHYIPNDLIINSIAVQEKQMENIFRNGSVQSVFAPRKIILKGKTISEDHDRVLSQYIIHLRNLPYFDRITPQPYEGSVPGGRNNFQLVMYIKNGVPDGSE